MGHCVWIGLGINEFMGIFTTKNTKLTNKGEKVAGLVRVCKYPANSAEWAKRGEVD
jgi:hypothetical protein